LQTFDETMQKQAILIEELQRELKGPEKRTGATQTIDSGMLELQYARQEVIKSQQCQEVVYLENTQLKDALQRNSYEVCRLIEDKRELEELIEKLNKNIGFFRSQHLRSGKTTFDQSLITVSADGENALLSKVLAEKENYIGNLENEISEMRKEIEI